MQKLTVTLLFLLSFCFLTAGCFNDVNAVDKNGATALHRASRTGDLKAIQELLKKHAQTNIIDKAGYSPLFLAVEYKHVDVARASIASEANIFIHPECDDTLLHRAARWDDLEMVKLLVDSGMDINVSDKRIFEAKPIHIAALCDSVNTIAYFLKKGQKVDDPSKNGMTPLHFTATIGNQGSLNAAKLLLDKGANVNAAALDGSTPLHIAAHFGKLNLVKLFIERGANKKLRRKDGKTAENLAVSVGDKEKLREAKCAVLDYLTTRK